MVLLRSILISTCMPLLTSRIAVGAAGVAQIAGELFGRLQRGGVAALQLDRELARDHAVGGHVGVAAGRERRGGVEERLGLGDHLVAARLVVAVASLARIVRDRVGAVESIIQAAPAGIRRVQRIAGVGQGNDELRSADLADFLVDICRLDLVGRGLRQEIADLLEEGRIGVHVERLALVGAVPAVDLGLQRVADGEQFAVFRSQFGDDGGKPGPECVGRNPGFGGRLLGDEIEQFGGDLQSVDIDTIHDGLSRSRNGVNRKAFSG